jgi:hypothetical protein
VVDNVLAWPASLIESGLTVDGFENTALPLVTKPVASPSLPNLGDPRRDKLSSFYLTTKDRNLAVAVAHLLV